MNKSAPRIAFKKSGSGHIPDALFIGAAHMDRIAQIEGEFTTGTSHPGSTRDHVGGAMLNTASLFSASGGRSTLISIIGQDGAGESVHKIATQRNLNPQFIIDETRATATYTAVHTSDGELVGGVADMQIYRQLSPESLTATGILQTGLASDICCVDANLTVDTLTWAAGHNPSPKLAVASVSIAKAHRIIPILSQIDLLFANRAQACVLADLPEASPAQICAEILDNQGVKSGIITDGGRKIHWWDENGHGTSNVPPLANPVVDVTGAGDALAGAALYSLLCGESFEIAVDSGIQAARLTLMIPGPYCPDIARVRTQMDKTK